MAKLKFLLAGEIHEWRLGSFVLTIGRSARNNIVIDEKTVAAAHAEIAFLEGRYMLRDLGSKTGTRINGARVESAPLSDGDTIQIGSIALRYASEQGAEQISEAAPATPVETAETALLDELVGSIRNFRARELDAKAQEIERIQREWDLCLRLAEELKTKVAGDTRIKYFGIDRRAGDVIIRIQRHPGGPQKMITVALHHPNYPGQLPSGLWLLRSEQNDRCLPTAQDVANELVRELAFALA